MVKTEPQQKFSDSSHDSRKFFLSFLSWLTSSPKKLALFMLISALPLLIFSYAIIPRQPQEFSANPIEFQRELARILLQPRKLQATNSLAKWQNQWEFICLYDAERNLHSALPAYQCPAFQALADNQYQTIAKDDHDIQGYVWLMPARHFYDLYIVTAALPFLLCLFIVCYSLFKRRPLNEFTPTPSATVTAKSTTVDTETANSGTANSETQDEIVSAQIKDNIQLPAINQQLDKQQIDKLQQANNQLQIKLQSTQDELFQLQLDSQKQLSSFYQPLHQLSRRLLSKASEYIAQVGCSDPKLQHSIFLLYKFLQDADYIASITNGTLIAEKLPLNIIEIFDNKIAHLTSQTNIEWAIKYLPLPPIVIDSKSINMLIDFICDLISEIEAASIVIDTNSKNVDEHDHQIVFNIAIRSTDSPKNLQHLSILQLYGLLAESLGGYLEYNNVSENFHTITLAFKLTLSNIDEKITQSNLHDSNILFIGGSSDSKNALFSWLETDAAQVHQVADIHQAIQNISTTTIHYDACIIDGVSNSDIDAINYLSHELQALKIILLLSPSDYGTFPLEELKVYTTLQKPIYYHKISNILLELYSSQNKSSTQESFITSNTAEIRNTILLVNDDVIIAEAINSHLPLADCDAITLQHPQDVLSWIELQSADIILLNIDSSAISAEILAGAIKFQQVQQGLCVTPIIGIGTKLIAQENTIRQRLDDYLSVGDTLDEIGRKILLWLPETGRHQKLQSALDTSVLHNMQSIMPKNFTPRMETFFNNAFNIQLSIEQQLRDENLPAILQSTHYIANLSQLSGLIAIELAANRIIKALKDKHEFTQQLQTDLEPIIQALKNSIYYSRQQLRDLVPTAPPSHDSQPIVALPDPIKHSVVTATNAIASEDNSHSGNNAQTIPNNILPNSLQPSSEGRLIDIATLQSSKKVLKQKFPIVLDHYFEDYTIYVTGIAQGLNTGNTALIIDNAHPLKSASLTLGFVAIGNVAKEIEFTARSDMPDDAKLGCIHELLNRLASLGDASKVQYQQQIININSS